MYLSHELGEWLIDSSINDLHHVTPHEKLLGIIRVSNPATRKDLADRTWGVFWY